MSRQWRKIASVFMAVGALFSVGVGSTLVVASISGPAGAVANCAAGVGISINPTIYEGTAPPSPSTLAPNQSAARVGDTISYEVKAQTDAGECAFSGGTVNLYLPSGTKVVLDTTLALTATAVVGDSHTYTSTYVVASGAIGASYPAVDPLTSGTVTVTAPTGNIRAFATVTGTATKTDGTHQTANAAADYDIPVLQPATSLGETESASSIRTGQSVTFTYTDTNTGTDPFTGVTLASTCLTDGGTLGTAAGDATNPTTLAVGAHVTWTCTITLHNATSSVVTFTDNSSVTATDATDSRPAPTTNESATASVRVGNPATSLAETESASSTGIRTGQSVTFTYTETNTGTDALTGVTLASTCLTAHGTLGGAVNPTTLAVGAHVTWTCTITLTNSTSSVTTFTDNSSVTATDSVDSQPAPTTNETASQSVQVRNPATSLGETESASSIGIRTGQSVTFTYTDTNTGTDALTGVTLASTCLTDGGALGGASNPTTLAVGAHVIWTCTITLSNATASVVTFTDNSSVTATDAVDTQPAPTTGESASKAVQVHNPATSLGETESASSIRTGQSVTFTYTDTNTGTDALTGVTLASTCLTDHGTLGGASNPTTLAVGAHVIWTCTITPASTTPPVTTFTDNSSVTATDGVDSQPAPTTGESANQSVQVVDLSTSLAESASASSVGSGGSVTFTYTDTNTGGGALTGVTLASTCLTDGGALGGAANPTTLAVGAHVTWTCTITLTTASFGTTFTDNSSVTATAAVDGQPAPTTGESASAQVTITTGTANLTPGYWKNHPAATTALLPQTLGSFPVKTFILAQRIMSEMGCGRYGALNCMAGMLLAADLNLAHGGSTCIVTNGTIAAANLLLVNHSYNGPAGVYALSASDQTIAMSLHDKLSAYNIDGIPTC